MSEKTLASLWPTSPAEIWVAASVSGFKSVSGNGTQSSPYCGIFDSILPNLPAQSLIHFGPGDYWTSGASPKAWQRWIGAGMRITRIHLIRPNTGRGSVLASNESGITIEDMTLDANGADGDTVLLNGCSLYGDHITVRRVLVVNAVGNWLNGVECFPIFVGLPTSNALSRSLISECEVSSCKGDYIAAISLDGQGIIEKCRVELPIIPFDRPCGFTAYQSSGSINTLIHACVSEGGHAGFYGDTYNVTNLSIRDCWFRNVLNGGVVLEMASSYSIDGINVDGNTIEFSQAAPSFSGQAGVTIITTPSGSLSNVRVCGNTIRYVDGFVRENTAVHIGDNATSVQVLGNTLGQGMKIIAPTNQQ